MKSRNSTRVYSSDHGRYCPKCGYSTDRCACKKKASSGGGAPKGDGKVRVGRSTKGRKGKGVTVITGVPLAGEELQDLARDLKRQCGSGGTVKDGTIEIQGDHRDVLVELLSKRGYEVKRSGG